MSLVKGCDCKNAETTSAVFTFHLNWVAKKNSSLMEAFWQVGESVLTSSTSWLPWQTSLLFLGDAT